MLAVTCELAIRQRHATGMSTLPPKAEEDTAKKLRQISRGNRTIPRDDRSKRDLSWVPAIPDPVGNECHCECKCAPQESMRLDRFTRRISRKFVYCDDADPPIFVPITSPEMMISTRRFCWRFFGVSLLATGLAGPKPCADTDAASRPCWIR
jgi:hypothetical protein